MLNIIKTHLGSGALIRNLLITSLVLAWSILLHTGCDSTPTEVADYQFEPYLSAFLVNGEPVAEVWLERVAPLELFYDPAQTGIRNATISITGGGQTLTFIEDPDSLGFGRYIPTPGTSLIPQSLVRYRIDVQIPNGETLWAESCMIGEIDSVVTALIDEETYQVVRLVEDGDTLNRDSPNLYFWWPPVDSAGGYQGKAVNLEPRDSLIPLAPDWDPNDPDDELEEEQRGRTGWVVMHREQQYTTLPWIYFSYQGWHRIDLSAVCPDYYEYLFSLMRAEQGLINSVHSNVHGGLGIFGSMSKFSLRIYLERTVPLP